MEYRKEKKKMRKRGKKKRERKRQRKRVPRTFALAFCSRVKRMFTSESA